MGAPGMVMSETTMHAGHVSAISVNAESHSSASFTWARSFTLTPFRPRACFDATKRGKQSTMSMRQTSSASSST